MLNHGIYKMAYSSMISQFESLTFYINKVFIQIFYIDIKFNLYFFINFLPDKFMSNRGLHNFLTEIYSGSTKQDIDIRINVELAKIKKAFFSPKLSPYNRKKYITKLCFIVLSGVQVCFGLPQIIDLIDSKKISAQRIGWMAAVIICGNDSNQVNELMPLIKRHLSDSKNENGINFTLSAISSIGSPELAESFGPTIAEIALSTSFSDFTRKKALLSLASFYRCSQLQLIDTIAGRLMPLLCDPSYGMRLSVSHLFHTIQIYQPSSIYGIFPQILEILNTFFIKNEYDHDYSASDIPCSILSALMIRILSFNTNWNEPEIKILENILTNILNRSSIKRNEDGLISYFTVFEEISIIALNAPIANSFIDRIFQIMVENVNSLILPIRYYCLDNLYTFIQFFPRLGSTIHMKLQTLYDMMVSQDSELNTRSIRLLYTIANKENGLDILTEFLNFIPKTSFEIRDLLFQKSALLALSFSIDEKWCIDTLVKLVCDCNNNFEIDLVKPLTIYITGNTEKQIYLIHRIYSILTTVNFESNFTNQFIRLSAYIFGEYSSLIQDENNIKTIIQKLMTFYQNIKTSDICKSMIVSCFFKICIKHENFYNELFQFINGQRKSMITEVSQRCCEYTQILSLLPKTFYNKISTRLFQNRRMPSPNEIKIQKFIKNDKKNINKTDNNITRSNSLINSLSNNHIIATKTTNILTKSNTISSDNIIYNKNINGANNVESDSNTIASNRFFDTDDDFSVDDESIPNDSDDNFSLSSKFLNSNEGQIFSNSICNVSVSFIIFPPNAKVSIFITNNSNNENPNNKNFIFTTSKLTSKNFHSEKKSSLKNLESLGKSPKKIYQKEEEEDEYDDEEEEEEEEEASSSFDVKSNDFIIVTNFSISTVKGLIFRVIDFPDNGSLEIEPGKSKEVIIEFVAVGIFDQMPLLTFEVNKETVKANIPIIFPRWIKEMEMDKATFSSRWNAICDPSHTASVSLVIPDGDVMSSIKMNAKKTFGLEPLNIDFNENIIVMCGVFKCLSNSIGFLLSFVFDESQNDLSLTIKTTSPLAIGILKKRAYSAFVL